MGESKTTNGLFCGKILTGTCTKKDGTKSNKYKLTFKPSETSDKTFTFSEFIPLDEAGKETPSKLDMKMSEWYNISYYETPGTYQGKDITYKNIASVTPGKGDVTPMNQGQSPAPQQILSPAEPETDTAKFVVAMAEYMDNVGDNADLKVATRMLGACLLRANPALYKARYDLCKEKIEKPKTPEPVQPMQL